MSPTVVIVDYGTGNLNSVRKSLQRLKVSPVVSSEERDITKADKIILPGVGHFGTAMSSLRNLRLVDALNEAVLEKQIPVLGICLGMEVMANRGDEGESDGLGWIDAVAVRFKIADKERFKLPHMGWNQIRVAKSSELMTGVVDGSEFYFAHSYHLQLHDRSDLLNETEYETVFASAIEKNNIFGVQYHPEKSHDAGMRVLKNFVEL